MVPKTGQSAEVVDKSRIKEIGVHANQITKRKRKAIEVLPEIFSNNK